MLKNYAVRLYVITWQLLRVFAGVYLMMRLILYTWLIYYVYTKPSQSYELPPVICGKMAGEMYEFSRLYFPFWPEYEDGASKRSYHVTKNGCDTDFKSIFMVMTWPGLEPAESHRVYERILDRGGLLVAATPILANESDIRQRRDHLLKKLSFQGAPVAAYDNSLGLYRAGGGGYSWGRRGRRLFWNEELGVVASVTICNWQVQEPDFYSCEMTFVMNGTLKVQVTMSPEMLVRWRAIRHAVEEFFVNNRKVES